MSSKEKIRIKNMVCPRCITAVKEVMDLHGIAYRRVELGEVELTKPLDDRSRERLAERLNSIGFELLESRQDKIISRVKTLIIQQVHHEHDPFQGNFSDFLANALHADYSALSKLFSSVEGITIEKYITRQKIERVKELLFYGELTLSEIAVDMHYSSTAHLSAQFKKETGMTPTEFRKSSGKGRTPLDKVR